MTSLETGTGTVPTTIWYKRLWKPAPLAGLAILLVFTGMWVPQFSGYQRVQVTLFFLGFWAAAKGLRRGVGSLNEVFVAPGGTLAAKVALVGAVFLNFAMALFGALATLITASGGFTRGRQLRQRGVVLLPGLRARGDWVQRAVVAAVPEELRGPLAAQWRENGRTEFASVAAFARLTLDLMALGAPPALITAANQDALDETRHAELCFSLARALDGRSESPGPFPEAGSVATLPRQRILGLAKLAVDSLVDGAVYEGVSARVVGKLARRCEDSGIRWILKTIAADEWRHSAHGWDVVDWCVAEGGAPVVQALRGALKTLPRTMRSGLPAAAHDGAWERFGIHGLALESEELGKTIADVERRIAAMISKGLAKAA